MSVTVTLPSRLAAWRDPASWSKASDIVAVLLALSLPWSTSLVGIFGVIFVLTVAPTIEWRAFMVSLRRPVSALPIALFTLAVVGTLWSDAPWGVRSYAIGPLAKLLVLPLLVYHFERSARGMWVFTAFLISCVLMMLMSWLVMLYPGFSIKRDDVERGIFVKNYIDQSQEFALCAVVLAFPIVTLLRAKKAWQALSLMALSVSFVANMAFVIVSRTAIVTLPMMMTTFALLHLKRRTSAMIICIMVGVAGLVWFVSPQLRRTTDTFVSDYQLYKEKNLPTSMGVRLEFWQKSLRFFANSPVIGHGTGSTRGLFEGAAVGTVELASGQVIGNPHNQTLAIAIQWGAIGVIVLYTMWLLHLRLFRGEGLVTWIGLMVVLQNIFSSLFNSHLFDFHEGWMYVLGVGVAGGMVLRAKSPQAVGEPAGAVKS
ncbi:O-antigen ligase [Afipia sp. GAS231]|uniref:O-antigen ligase family protein n=1 Tax=Afipia sp. GAS231 TaxID=1882747 RepID=UPI00087A0E01|nr:O-antigen ligase family protein [Afipia sp. GAS231]SDN33984.1 O-Antigen ligase [Afipia sp. GAS231]